jgi:hypothetical protein
MISARGAAPAAAQAYYQLPFRVHDAPSAIRLAAYLEDGVTRGVPGPWSRSAISGCAGRRDAMQDAAQRAASWRGSTLAFPGMSPPAS